MKQPILLSIIILVLISVMGRLPAGANTTQSFMDTITTAPKGALIKDGKLYLARGYKIRYSADGKIGTAYRASDDVVVFFFKCPCYDCGYFPPPALGCMSGCCILRGSLIIQIPEDPQSNKSDWKVLVIPKTRITTTSN